MNRTQNYLRENLNHFIAPQNIILSTKEFETELNSCFNLLSRDGKILSPAQKKCADIYTESLGI